MTRGTSDRWGVEDIPGQGGRTAVVTGANRGLGLIVARELARSGAEVVIGCRTVERGEEAARDIAAVAPGAHVTVLELDLADLASIQTFTRRFIESWDGLDLLINNAAIAAVPQRRTTADGFESQFGTNHLGHFALTGLLLASQHARPGARIVSITAQLNRIGRINIDDLQGEQRYSRWRAYAQSKLATLMFAIELDRRLRAANLPISSVAAHPGAARTHPEAQAGAPLVDRLFNAFTNRFAAKSPDEGALPYLYAATAPELPGGSYVGPATRRTDRPAGLEPPARAVDEEMAARLWSLSEALTGVRYVLASSASGTS